VQQKMNTFLRKKISYLGLGILTASVTLFLTHTYAETAYFSAKTPYQVCFTPGQNCTHLIVDAINQAKQSVYVQAYSFTSAPIAQAIVEAKHRGLDVKVILDKSQIRKNSYSSAKYLMNNHIDTFIDHRPAIAHNKVIIIDNNALITGSFNFSKSAQMRNAENVIIIHDHDLSKKYLENWIKRKNQSVDAKDYHK
jgi:phosphatidylserine/phosphatidylglycerophosphate/cardiolipin synthase-like enzyme